MSRWGESAHAAPAARPVPDAVAASGVPDALRWPDDLQTPCYVFDPQVVLARHDALRRALGTGLLVSLKANPNPDLFLRSAQAFVDGIELASPGELELAVGRGRHDLYLNNPSLGDDFIRAGIASRARFVVDGVDMADRLISLATGSRQVQVLLRVNVAALLGRRCPPGWVDHFGLAPRDSATVAHRLADAGLQVLGLHAFAGSNNFRIATDRNDDPLGDPSARRLPAPERRLDATDLADALARLADALSPTLPEPLACLNLGGGFDAAAPADVEAMRRYRAAIAPLAARFRLLHEAGRAIYAEAGEFVTRVTALKHHDDRIVAVCDGGLSHNFLLAQTESICKAWRAPYLTGGDRGTTAPAPDPRPVVFVGNTCHRGDVIGRLPPGSVPPRRGQFAVFDRCGAYHATYTVGGFLSQRPAHVYIRQGAAP